MNVFFVTIQIVFGILTPIFVLAVIYLIGQIYQDRKQLNIRLREKQEKENPYDELLLEEVPNPKMYKVKMMRNGKVVHEQGVYKI